MRAREQAISRCGEIKSIYISDLGLKLKLCFGLQTSSQSQKARRQGHRSHEGEDAAQEVEELLA